MSNVPDDWGCYYTKCSLCETRYHMSEGGCSCTDDLECQCGSGCWEGNSADSLTCSDCGTGPHEDLSTKRTVACGSKGSCRWQSPEGSEIHEVHEYWVLSEWSDDPLFYQKVVGGLDVYSCYGVVPLEAHSRG